MVGAKMELKFEVGGENLSLKELRTRAESSENMYSLHRAGGKLVFNREVIVDYQPDEALLKRRKYLHRRAEEREYNRMIGDR